MVHLLLKIGMWKITTHCIFYSYLYNMGKIYQEYNYGLS